MIRRHPHPADVDETALESEPLAALVGSGAKPGVRRRATPRELRRARLLEDPAAAMRIAPRLGWSSPLAGRAASLHRSEVMRADTARACGIFPFLHAGSVPALGAYIGFNTLTQTAFSAHPSEWVSAGLVTNPNVLLTGIPGSGKSAHIKALCLRLGAFGHRTLIAGDVKGEYTPLCRALGVDPVRLGPGLARGLNPLDAGALEAEVHGHTDLAAARRAEIHRRRLDLLGALLALHLHRPLTPTDEEALDVALREVTGELHAQTSLATPTLAQVYAVLRDPTPAMVRELRVRGEEIQLAREQMATLRSALGRMITGHLSGLFDADTTLSMDWDAPIQCVDISALRHYGDETVAMVLTCVSSWAQAALDRPGPPRIVVRDELWRQMRAGAAMVKKIDADLRLSRAEGVIDILATHRLSDLEAVGAAGSEAVAIARGLIASCETRIQLRQDTQPLALTREAIGLTDAECALIESWGPAHRGRALWKLGSGGGHAVQLQLSRSEIDLFETDERMAM